MWDRHLLATIVGSSTDGHTNLEPNVQVCKPLVACMDIIARRDLARRPGLAGP